MVFSWKQRIWMGTLTFTVCFPFLPNAIMPVYKNTRQQPTRTVIVTGASGNLGSVLTFQIAKRKARVIMACRDMEKCRMVRRELVVRLGTKAIVCRHLDLEDIDSINRFADEMIKTEPHIDVLINNAAIKHIPQRELNKHRIERTYFVNFLGPFLLTLRLMSKLEESAKITRDSRVVNVIGGPKKNWEVDPEDINFEKRNYTGTAAYNQSKLALAYFTILLDKFNRAKGNCVYVYGANPLSNKISEAFYKPNNFLDHVSHLMSNFFAFGPENCSSPAAYCALEPTINNPKFSGKLYGLIFSSRLGWGKADKDETKAKLVWNSAIDLLANDRRASADTKPEAVENETIPDNNEVSKQEHKSKQ